MARKKREHPDVHVSGGPSNDTWSEWIRKATLSKRVIDEATGAHRAVLKAAKASGCNPKIVMQAVQAKKLDESTVIAELRDYVRALNAHRIEVTSAVLFTGWEPPAKSADGDDFDVEQAGYDAGFKGADSEMNPYDDDDARCDPWETGRQRGASAAEMEAVPGTTAASAKRGRMPTSASADDGTATAGSRRGGGKKRGASATAEPDTAEWPSGVSGTA